jgi:hypothetical protein
MKDMKENGKINDEFERGKLVTKKNNFKLFMPCES